MIPSIKMPKKRYASEWKRKALIQDLATGLPFAACLLAGAFGSRFYFIAAIVFFLVGFILQRIRFRRAKCQGCGDMLKRQMKDASHITFHCSACDVIWVTETLQDGEPS